MHSNGGGDGGVALQSVHARHQHSHATTITTTLPAAGDANGGGGGGGGAGCKVVVGAMLVVECTRVCVYVRARVCVYSGSNLLRHHHS